MTVSAYPYAAWPRMRRADAVSLRRMLRALPLPTEVIVAEAQALLGAQVQVVPLTPELSKSAAAAESMDKNAVALWLELQVGAQSPPLICEFSREFGAALVDRLLGGDGRPAPPAGDLDPMSLGLLGYLAARLTALTDGTLSLRAVLSDHARVEALLGDTTRLVWPLRLALGGEPAGILRILIPESSAQYFQNHAATPKSHAHLLHLPLTLCVHAAQLTLPRADLEALAIGDVIVPERIDLRRCAQGWQGEVMLHVSGARDSAYLCSARASELTLLALECKQGLPMTQTKRIEAQSTQTTPDAERLAGDAPIELCLQLARFSMTLAELSALRQGEVLSTGRPIGERVTLSASGRAIAHGELVDVDGEIGLRVLELVSD